jgi:hypothetical protein
MNAMRTVSIPTGITLIKGKIFRIARALLATVLVATKNESKQA